MIGSRMAPITKLEKTLSSDSASYSPSASPPSPTPTPPVVPEAPPKKVPPMSAPTLAPTPIPTHHVTNVLAEINKRVTEATNLADKMARLEKIVASAIPAAMSDVVAVTASMEKNLDIRMRALEDLVRGLVEEIAVLVAPVSVPREDGEIVLPTLPGTVGVLSSTKPLPEFAAAPPSAPSDVKTSDVKTSDVKTSDDKKTKK